MTVDELRAALDDFGGHLPVLLVVTRGNAEHICRDFTVGTYSRADGFAVELEGEQS